MFLLFLQASTGVCDHTVAGPFFKSGSEFRAVSETAAVETVSAGVVEVQLQESGCAHFGLTVRFRWRKGQPSVGEASSLLHSLKASARGGPVLRMLETAMRRTTPEMMGKPQAREDGGSIWVTQTADTVTVSYDFPL